MTRHEDSQSSFLSLTGSDQEDAQQPQHYLTNDDDDSRSPSPTHRQYSQSQQSYGQDNRLSYSSQSQNDDVFSSQQESQTSRRHRNYSLSDDEEEEESGQTTPSRVRVSLDSQASRKSDREDSDKEEDSGNDGSDSSSSDESDDGFESEHLSPADVMERMESLAEAIVQALADQRLPELTTYQRKKRRKRRRRSLLLTTSSSNDKTKRIVFHNLQQCRSFANILLVLSFCHALLLSGRTTTTREVYYFHVTHFRSQKECDAAIVEAAKLLRIPRSSLGLFASPKGWYCGCIQILRQGRIVLDGQALSSIQGSPITQEWLQPQRDFTIDCRAYASDESDNEEENDDGSTSSAASPPAPRKSTTRAKCILVIEKEGVYNRFSEDRLFDRFPCILVTGKGFPDVATRSFVYTVHKELNLPVYGIADCNPFGLLVLQTYQYGSAKLGLEGGSRYSVPLRWLGLRPSQVEEIQDGGQGEDSGSDGLPAGVFQKLTDLDKKRLEQLLDETHRFHAGSPPEEERYEELELMEENGYKVELESLNWLGMEYIVNWAHGALTKAERARQEEEEAAREEKDGSSKDERSNDGNQDEQSHSSEGSNDGEGDEARFSASMEYMDESDEDSVDRCSVVANRDSQSIQSVMMTMDDEEMSDDEEVVGRRVSLSQPLPAF